LPGIAYRSVVKDGHPTHRYNYRLARPWHLIHIAFYSESKIITFCNIIEYERSIRIISENLKNIGTNLENLRVRAMVVGR